MSRPSPINPGVKSEPKSNPSVILAKDAPIPAAASTKVKRDDHHGTYDNHNQHHNQHHDQHHDDHHGSHHKREALSDALKTDDKKRTPALITPVPKQAPGESEKPKRKTPLPINSGPSVNVYRANSANKNSVSNQSTTAKSNAKSAQAPSSVAKRNSMPGFDCTRVTKGPISYYHCAPLSS